MFLSRRSIRRYILLCSLIAILFLVFGKLNKINKSNEIKNSIVNEYPKDIKNTIVNEKGEEIKPVNNDSDKEKEDVLNNSLKIDVKDYIDKDNKPVTNNSNDEKDDITNNYSELEVNNYTGFNDESANNNIKENEQNLSSGENNEEEEEVEEEAYKLLLEENSGKKGTVNKSYIKNDKADTGITELKKLELERKKDLEYINNYKGGALEPEWEWARNISVVYTWVDGQDINFSNIKSKYNGGYRSFNSRDRSVDELRYSLRSLKQYMPWHNGTIYILTDNQIPNWLDTSNPRIQMVYHKDIFPEHYRPTYDSNVIELFLDKIPGITEYFIYFNDDIFLNNYVHPCFFFTSENHYPKAYRSYIVNLTKEKTDEIIKQNSVVKMFQATKYFTRKTLREYFDPEFEYRYCLHTAYVIYRDMMEPFRQLFKDEIKMACSDKFRSPYERHMLYMYQTYLYYGSENKDFPEKVGGTGKVKNYVGSPLPPDPNRTVKKYSCEMVPPATSAKFIKFGSITDQYDKNAEKLQDFINDPDLRIFNLNDEYSKDESLCQFVEFMITRYPNATEFEKKEYVDLDLTVQPILSTIQELAKNHTSEALLDDNLNKVYDNLQSNLSNYSFNMIQMYLNKKDSLTKPQSEVSQIELEEVDFILKHSKVDILEDEWQWASDISIVYKLEHDSSSNVFVKSEQLKYSLRSIEKYLPWFKGKIFIVTIEDKKKIPWLKKNNNRIQVIPQSKLIPKNKNKNKYTLEMYLDKIPGLSEKFIYLKPNHYFIKYTHPRFFFSEDFYPKYNYYKPLSKKDAKGLKKKNKSLNNTYNIIKEYFGEHYFKAYRFLFDSPYPLYRDLFEPIRKLLGKKMDIFFDKSINYLPIYLITNYNIYGTNQPFYPEYVAGYGKIRNATAPILNKDRKIDYYGYDIPSPYTLKKILLPNIQFSENNKNNKVMIDKVKYSKALFFNVRFKNKQKMTNKNKNQILELFNYLYQEKSNFEK